MCSRIQVSRRDSILVECLKAHVTKSKRLPKNSDTLLRCDTLFLVQIHENLQEIIFRSTYRNSILTAEVLQDTAELGHGVVFRTLTDDCLIPWYL